MNLPQAKLIAMSIVQRLAPFCSRIEIAGSIRRQKPEVGDIEIVCVPQSDAEPDLFADPNLATITRSQDWIREAYRIGTIAKGNPMDGRYIKFLVETRDQAIVQLDLFLATPENWGLIFAIRTGSAAYSHHVLATGWVRHGYHSKNGILIDRAGRSVPVREEEELFRLIGRPFVEPQFRNM
jgi:DNA polymerase/3'-5' exonuclease PolX